jgi:hypothetical protein
MTEQTNETAESTYTQTATQLQRASGEAIETLLAAILTLRSRQLERF